MSIKNNERKFKTITVILILIGVLCSIIISLSIFQFFKMEMKIAEIEEYNEKIQMQAHTQVLLNEIVNAEKEKQISDWQLTLVNYENTMEENYKVELSSIDNIRKFDSRAIGDLNQMILDMKKIGLKNIWIQSAYRTIEEQEKLFNNKVNYFLSIGKTEEDAERLTLRMINKPGTSEHNLGLAVDFNYVNKDFEKTKEFKWLLENAENYGFILRYKEEKRDITKVYYEPWHWRYVGIEHAKKMNELDMCLEEYIEYLKSI